MTYKSKTKFSEEEVKLEGVPQLSTACLQHHSHAGSLPEGSGIVEMMQQASQRLEYRSCGYILNVLLTRHPRSGHGMLLKKKTITCKLVNLQYLKKSDLDF